MRPYDALTRTVLLIRDFVTEAEASDDDVVKALTSTTVAIVADEATATLPAAQAAITSLAGQVLAFGASLRLVLPDVPIAGEQPPLRGGRLLEALIDYAADLIPGALAESATAPSSTDIVFLVGSTARLPSSRSLTWRLGWTKWSGVLAMPDDSAPAIDADVPIGALVAATLGAAEAFKVSVRALLATAGVLRVYDELSATHRAVVRVAPEDTVVTNRVFGRVDVVSGGAIANAFLHGLLRIPQAGAAVRVFEPETLDISNINRYALARRSAVGQLKTRMLESQGTDRITITGEPIRFDENTPPAARTLAPIVLVGTDDIPSRWFVQSLRPQWLCVGATIHFTAMASEHDGDSACAGCLHPEDDDVNALVATVSFVSYWAGLLLLVRLLRRHSNRPVPAGERVLEVATLQAGETRGVWIHPVRRNPRCPVRCGRAA
jgi:hypothetical protein